MYLTVFLPDQGKEHLFFFYKMRKIERPLVTDKDRKSFGWALTQDTYCSIVLIKSDSLYWFLIKELIHKPSMILSHKCVSRSVCFYGSK